MIPDLVIGSLDTAHGFEFHYALPDSATRGLCGAAVRPTQIPAHFYGIESAIEGRWCQRCERLSRERTIRSAVPEPTGDAPCL